MLLPWRARFYNSKSRMFISIKFYFLFQLEPTSSCKTAMMKMLYCPYCRGFTELKPCNNYCMNIMRGCLAQQSELNWEWNQYICKYSSRYFCSTSYSELMETDNSFWLFHYPPTTTNKQETFSSNSDCFMITRKRFITTTCIVMFLVTSNI